MLRRVSVTGATPLHYASLNGRSALFFPFLFLCHGVVGMIVIGVGKYRRPYTSENIGALTRLKNMSVCDTAGDGHRSLASFGYVYLVLWKF
jgi:hypothetical protein